MTNNIPPEIYYKEPHKIDWVNSHKTNSDMGKLGEDLVLNLEKRFLEIMGKNDLACEVCAAHDWSGYDVRSYFPDGREKFIEVKTTSKELEGPYFLSRNELKFLADNRENAFIYRVSISNGESSSRLRVYNFTEVIHAEILPIKFKVKH